MRTTVLVDHVLRDVGAQTGQRIRLVVRHAPHTCRHLIFRRQVLSERRPFAAAAPHDRSRIVGVPPLIANRARN
jgi:hypothetical protein